LRLILAFRPMTLVLALGGWPVYMSRMVLFDLGLCTPTPDNCRLLCQQFHWWTSLLFVGWSLSFLQEFVNNS
jgi:hypothetical protein